MFLISSFACLLLVYRKAMDFCIDILIFYLGAADKSLQSCPTLCDPVDGSPPGSPVPGILQVRTLEWVAISFSNAWKWKVKVKSLSRAGLLATPWTAAYQAPPSMGFSRQEYWSGVPSPSPNRLSYSLAIIIYKFQDFLLLIPSDYLHRLSCHLWTVLIFPSQSVCSSPPFSYL